MHVSVIIPIFNVENYVAECLASVVGQTHRDLEIILVDDVSTDGSVARCAPFLKDPRVRLITHKQNRGLSAARNSGIDAATGDYLLFVDSDDVVSDRLVETCVAAAKKFAMPIHFFQHRAFVDGTKPGQLDFVSSVDVPARVIEGGDPSLFAPPYFAWLKFINRSWLVMEGIGFREGELYEDHRFHWALAGTGLPVVSIDASLYAYRVRKSSITADPMGAIARLDILRELITAREAHLSPRALEAGERALLAACVGLLATVPYRSLPTTVSRVCAECALIRNRSSSLRAQTLVEWALLWIAAKDNSVARTALLSLVRLARVVKQCMGRSGL